MPTPRLTSQFEREGYNARRLGMPELEVFGYTATPTADQLGLARHSHPQAWEICLINDGHVSWWAGRQVYQLGPGSIYITRPGEAHGGADDMLQPCSLYWLQVRLRRSRPMFGLSPAEMRRLVDDYQALVHRSFYASAVLREAFGRLHVALRDRPRHGRPVARAALHTLLVQVVRDHHAMNGRGEAFGNPTPAISDAMARIEQRLDENIPVHVLADEVGLGVSRFHQRFAEEVGFSPADYRLHLRIRRARQWLRETDHPVTRIAHKLGFSSSQHFATAFRRLVGLSPTAYRDRGHR